MAEIEKHKADKNDELIPKRDITKRPGDWFEAQKTSIGVRYQIIFGLTSTLSVIVFIIALIFSIIIGLLQVAFVALAVCATSPFVVVVLCFVFRSRLRLSPNDIPANQVWYVEKRRPFLHSVKTRFIEGAGDIRWLALDEVALPFMDEQRLIHGIEVKQVLTRDGSTVSAIVDIIGRFEPERRHMTRQQVTEIVNGGRDLMIRIIDYALHYIVRSAIRNGTYRMALQLPESRDDQRNIVAITEYIIANFANYPDVSSSAFTLLAVDYQPERPKNVEKQIERYRGYIEGISIGFNQAAENGRIPQVLFTQFATLRTLEGLPPRAQFPREAYKLDTSIAELFSDRGALTPVNANYQLPSPSMPEPIRPDVSKHIAMSDLPDTGEYVPKRVEEVEEKLPIDIDVRKPGMTPIRILHIEDEAGIRNIISDILDDLGESYELHGVASKDEAIQKLQDELFHILLCDIALKPVDPEGNTDVGGIEVIEELKAWGQLEHFRVIMNSKETQMMRRVMAGYRDVVDDFIPKTELDEHIFLAAVRKSADRLNVNFALRIGTNTHEWSNPGNYLYWLHKDLLIIGSGYPRVPSERRKISELVLLIMKLYKGQYEQVILEPLAHGDYPLSGKVRPILADQVESPSEWLQVGSHRDIKRVVDCFNKHIIQPGIVQHTSIASHERTPWLAGAVYTFPESVDSLQHLGEYFFEQSDPTLICQQISILFKSLENWYVGERRIFEEGNLTVYYLSALALPHNVSYYYLVHPQEQISEGDKVLVGSVDLEQIAGWRFRHPKPTKIRTHGNLLAQNVLLGTENRQMGLATIHLWDTFSTDWGHPLMDFTRLEMDLKLNVLPKQVNIETYRRAENMLTFNANHRPKDREILKLIACVRHIRSEAQQYLRSFGYHQDEYWCALLFNTFEFMSRNNDDTIRKRAAVSAGFLMQQLKLIKDRGV